MIYELRAKGWIALFRVTEELAQYTNFREKEKEILDRVMDPKRWALESETCYVPKRWTINGWYRYQYIYVIGFHSELSIWALVITAVFLMKIQIWKIKQAKNLLFLPWLFLRMFPLNIPISFPGTTVGSDLLLILATWKWVSRTFKMIFFNILEMKETLL